MDECCTPKCWAIKLLIVGLIFIINQVYFKYDIWVIIGILMIVKAIVMFFMPNCCCQRQEVKKKR